MKNLPQYTAKAALLLFATLSLNAVSPAFEVDRSPNPPDYAAEEPATGETVTVNPPSLVWRMDARAASYIIELAQSADFKTGVVRVENVAFPFYNHSQALSPGRWFWRYYVKTANGEVSDPGPVRSFMVDEKAVKLPVPSMATILEKMPQHPRIFVTPATLAEFRARRNGPAKDAWAVAKSQADRLLGQKPALTAKRVPLETARKQLTSIKTPGISGWKKGDPTRRQVFWLDENGNAFWTPDYTYNNLNTDAGKAQVLAYAYLISGDEKYAAAARPWLDFVSQFRIDYHLGNVKKRAAHDTASYCYEQGLKNYAVAYDHIYNTLSAGERQRAIAHVEYHTEAAVEWLKAAKIEVRYQQSHPQQTMHNTLTALLAVATDSPKLSELTSWVLPQYMNRIAWTSPDGGYFEGPVYAHKFRWILEGLTAIRTATGVDLFKKPEIHNSGAYWLYAMDMNYWYLHFGDIYSLLWASANNADSYISGLMAEMTQDPYVKWYSQTVLANPNHNPFRYLAEGPLKPKPPIDIPQARAFPDTGVVTAYDKFWDHRSNRVFFRSSPWGAHSHSHADQNGFVIHSNGEILAPDTGYYTYSGDTYNKEWSKATFSHNSMLVNGKGQPTNIDSKGKIATFFNGGRFTYYVGDASKAYEEPLQTYRRALLFVRPNLYIVYDELAAGQPSTYSWLLNTFAKPEIDNVNQRLTVAQQGERLQVDNLLPRGLTYTTTNERPYPIKTRAWSRITEEFPQAWHTRATTPAKTNEGMLSLMQTFDQSEGAQFSVNQRFETPSTIGMTVAAKDGRQGTILFNRQLDRSGAIESGNLQANAQAATLFSQGTTPAEWMLVSGTTLTWQGKTLLTTQNAVSAEANLNPSTGTALLNFDGNAGQVQVALATAPRQLFFAPGGNAGNAKPLAVRYENGLARFEVKESGTVWVDPTVNPAATLPAATLTVQDSQGSYTVPMQGAWSQSGEWVYYAQTDAREPGTYAFKRNDGAAQFLIQDIWQPTKTVHTDNNGVGIFREATELYFTVAPGEKAPQFSAQLQTSFKGQLVNLLRNGDFEEGIPAYPPRQWTMQRPGSESDDLGYGHWSQEDKRSGLSSLRFFRAGDQRTLTAQPLRLRTAGEYHLRFFAKGDADKGVVKINDGSGNSTTVEIEPSAQWREYQTKVQLPPGYTTVQVVLGQGEGNKTLWLDDLELGRIAQ